MNVYAPALAVIALTATMSNASLADAREDEHFGDGPIVVTDSGPLRGTVNATTVAFRGIPYARPPVGNLR